MAAGVRVEVNIESDKATQMLRNLVAEFSPRQMVKLNRLGANVLLEEIKDYHRAFGAAGGWDNPAALSRRRGPGKRRSTKFAAQVVKQWRVERVNRRGFVLTNNSFLSQKIDPQPIVATRAKFLTIPLLKEAHGRTAAQYSAFKKRILFPIPGKKALFELFGKSKIRAVYALKARVIQKPVKGAFPSKSQFDQMSQEVAERVTDQIIKDTKPKG